MVARKLSLRELKYLKSNEPKYYKIARKTFTESAGTPTVTVEEVT